MIINKDLYQQILQVMPIPCIDLIVVDDYGQILLAKRRNDPARGEWWFPGGRIYFMEIRLDAAVRKLREECGLEAVRLIELGTFDVIMEGSGNTDKSHAITTIFAANVGRNPVVILDEQNSAAEWHPPSDWLKVKLNPFIEKAITIFTEHNEKISELFKISLENNGLGPNKISGAFIDKDMKK